MNLEDIMLREIASHKRANIVWLYLYKVSRTVKFIERENRMVVARAGEGKNERLLFNGYCVSIWEDEKVLEIDGSDG